MMVEMWSSKCTAGPSGCSRLNFLHELAQKSGVKDESVTCLGCVLLWVWFACWLCSSVLVP